MPSSTFSSDAARDAPTGPGARAVTGSRAGASSAPDARRLTSGAFDATAGTPQGTPAAVPPLGRPVPAQPWGRLLATVAVVTLLCGAVWEGYWRAHALEPGDYEDSPVRWRWARERATGDATVLVGSSRMFEDIDCDAWTRATGRRPVQLAIPGQNPTPVLADLAGDRTFHGLVLVEVTPYLFFLHPTAATERVMRGGGAAGPGERVGQRLSDALERKVGAVDGEARLATLWRRLPLPLRAGQFPVRDVPKGNTMGADRCARMWRRLTDDRAYRDHYRWIWMTYAGDGGRPPGLADAVARTSAAVAHDVAAIRARGGAVVFVRFPSAGPLAASEERSMPRAATWAPLLAATGAPGVHFADDPALRAFAPPDWSHLAPDQARAFTAALAPLVLRIVLHTEAERR